MNASWYYHGSSKEVRNNEKFYKLNQYNQSIPKNKILTLNPSESSSQDIAIDRVKHKIDVN